MKEQGTMFSAPMVRAIDAGRKTQTRRLASSPLAKLPPGRQLWVRETFRFDTAYDNLKPVDCPPRAAVWYEADGAQRGEGVAGKCRPAIHMPRFAARIGLKLESVRIEPLHAISEADAIAEGIVPFRGDPTYTHHVEIGPGAFLGGANARKAYKRLWTMLHTKAGERWEDNPDVVVLTFSKAWIDG